MTDAPALKAALGQIANIENAVTMDLKSAGNRLLLIGETKDELGGAAVHGAGAATGVA